MAAFIFKLGALDLSGYLRVNPDDHMDPQGAPWIEPAFTQSPFTDGQPLLSTTVHNREQTWPLFLRDPSTLKDQLHALIAQINNAAAQRPLLLEWRDSGASSSTFYDVQFVRFEPDFNYRRSVHGYGAGVLHVWTSGYGHTGTTRVTATAAGSGIFLSVPIASIAGDAPALLDTTIITGAIVPSLGRIVAIAPITQPSYTPLIPAASLLAPQAGATLIGASGAQGSQYLALPVAPTGGASGICCQVPLQNPTIMGGDNRVLAIVRAGIDAGVAVQAIDPYGNVMGPTAVASHTQAWGVIDLGVCRLPTVGYPTAPRIGLLAGGVWSAAGRPVILASPAGLAINEIIVLPDKNTTLLYETLQRSGGAGASAISIDGFSGQSIPLRGANDQSGNGWQTPFNLAHAGDGTATGAGIFELGGYISQAGSAETATLAYLDANTVANVWSDSMLIKAKVAFASPGLGFEEVDLFKDRQPSAFARARLAASGFMSLSAATGGPTGNLLASVAIPTLVAGAKYRLSLNVQGPAAWVNLTKDDGGQIYAPASGAYASIGVASNAALAGAGNPGVAMSLASYQPNVWGQWGLLGFGFPQPWVIPAAAPQVSGWEVDSLAIPASATSNLAAYDAYRIDGPNSDSYRTSSAGVFAGQKLNGVQRGAFVKMAPSSVALAVLCAPCDQGVANDLISAVVSVRERFVYGR